MKAPDPFFEFLLQIVHHTLLITKVMLIFPPKFKLKNTLEKHDQTHFKK